MQQFKCYGDERNKGFCVHCGGPYETDDHVPSKVLLDEPYPKNMIVCSSCLKCNNTLSADEEYLACLLECVLAGEANTAKIFRQKIAGILDRKPLLLERLRKAKSDANNSPIWAVEQERVKTVVLKLARGHTAYEYNEPRLEEPDHVSIVPLATMSDEERQFFENSDVGQLAAWPEVGSRALQRLLVDGSDVFVEGWLVVQEGNYRFKVLQEDGLIVRIVLREYLACEVIWS